MLNSIKNLLYGKNKEVLQLNKGEANNKKEEQLALASRDRTHRQVKRLLLSQRDARPDITVEQYQHLEAELLLNKSEVLTLRTELARSRNENVNLIHQTESQKQIGLKKSREGEVIQTELKKIKEHQRVTIESMQTQPERF